MGIELATVGDEWQALTLHMKIALSGTMDRRGSEDFLSRIFKSALLNYCLLITDAVLCRRPLCNKRPKRIKDIVKRSIRPKSHVYFAHVAVCNVGSQMIARYYYKRDGTYISPGHR